MTKLGILFAALLVLGTLLVAGCAPSGPKEYTSPSQPIEVKIGESFMITLESNPTTGYKWEASFDQNLLKLLVKSEFKQDASKPGMVGVGGREQFTFSGLKSGDAQVKMTYKRPWEQTASDKVLNFTVKIKK